MKPDPAAPRGCVGLNDLARIYAVAGPEIQAFAAEMMGYRLRPVAPDKPETPPKRIDPDRVEVVVDDDPDAVAPPPPSQQERRARFLIPTEFEAFEPLDVPSTAPVETPVTAIPDPEPVEPLPFEPLARRADLLTQMRRAFAERVETNEPDVDAVVADWSRGRLVRTIPRRRRRSVGRSLTIVVDRSGRLAPFWTDQAHVVEWLRRVFPREGFRVAVLPESRARPSHFSSDDDVFTPYEDPSRGGTLLVLGDLGTLDPEAAALAKFWKRWGRSLKEAGVRLAALVPCRRSNLDPDLAALWNIAPWEAETGRGGIDEAAAVDSLLTLLCFTLRIEPQLLRRVRRMVDGGPGRPEIEASFWSNDALLTRHSEAAALRKDRADELRRDLARRDRNEREKVHHWAKRLHQRPTPEVWWHEVLNLYEPDPADAVVAPGEIAYASARIRGELGRVENAGPEDARRLLAWHRMVSSRVLEAARRSPAGEDLKSLWTLSHGDDPDRRPPWETRTLEIRQHGDRLLVEPFRPTQGWDGTPYHPGSLIVLLRTRSGRVTFRFGDAAKPIEIRPGESIPIETFGPFRVKTDLEAYRVDVAARPEWAGDFARDRYGLWGEFFVTPVLAAEKNSPRPVRQRLRWIPPGRFLMGAPKDEAGRWSRDQEPHAMRIETGFWIFDTPCTQELWEAVTGEKNPSWFVSPTRPVEQVTWDDANRFAAKLNERVKGLPPLGLPSEAGWEYACRAGTATATYAGDLEILGANNAPVLHPIAWYGGNSGVDFELDNGYDSSGWPDKQIEHTRAGSHPVARKAANPWGLHDMLGNVWEWCYDAWDDTAAARVIRGGSWSLDAWSVRSACRNDYRPSGRGGDLGFRCSSSGSVASQEKGGASGTRSGAGAEPGGAGAPPGR